MVNSPWYHLCISMVTNSHCNCELPIHTASVTVANGTYTQHYSNNGEEHMQEASITMVMGRPLCNQGCVQSSIDGG